MAADSRSEEQATRDKDRTTDILFLRPSPILGWTCALGSAPTGLQATFFFSIIIIIITIIINNIVIMIWVSIVVVVAVVVVAGIIIIRVAVDVLAAVVAFGGGRVALALPGSAEEKWFHVNP